MIDIKEDMIARQFSRAAASYDLLACIQKRIAKEGLAMLPGAEGRLLDIGCATGSNTWHLAQRGFIASGIDLAPGMVDYARGCYPELEFVHGDAQNLPFKPDTFDRVFSSMALQWCPDVTRVMEQIFKVLKPGGIAGLTIMVAGSFEQLNQSRANAGLEIVTNSMPAHQQWVDAAHASGLTVNSALKKQYIDSFADILTLLRSIKNVGAGTRLIQAPLQTLSRARLRQLERAYYEYQRADGSFPLTYQVSHLILEK